MRRLPLPRRVLMAVTACCAVAVPVLSSPGAAWAEAPNAGACGGLYHGDPPGSLAITTNPPSGTVLHPGDGVEVTATWDVADWPAPVLHKVLDCLLVNGSVDYDRSSQEKPTENDGYYRYRFTVPAGTGRICDRVRLSGRLVEGGDLAVQKSNTICFSFAAAGSTSKPGSPVEATTQGAAPADQGTPTPLQPVEPTPDVPTTTEAAATPAPPLQLSAVTVPMLPRTGSDPLPLARLGALLVLLGGVTLAARAALSIRGTSSRGTEPRLV